MAYSKDDFIDFSALDLDELLGEYTNSEIELSDDDSDDMKRKCRPATSADKKKYKCGECPKSYPTVSGLRVHLRIKHRIVGNKDLSRLQAFADDKINVHQKLEFVLEMGEILVRKGESVVKSYIKSTHIRKNPFTAHESDFPQFFNIAFKATLKSMSLTAKQREFSTKRKAIGELAEKVCSEKELFDKVVLQLRPHFCAAFQKAGDTTCNMTEALYVEFYKITVKKELDLELRNMTQGSRVFVGVLLHELVEHLIINLSSLFEHKHEAQNKEMTDTEQRVLYYISGYLLFAIKKKAERGSSFPRQKALLEAMKKSIAMDTCDHSRRNFVDKYSNWLQKVNRGGLTVPSDNFFLLIREMEMCVRQASAANQYGIERLFLTESILDNFMVKYYSNKLFKGPFELYIVDAIANLFLNLRGHAWAQLLKNGADMTDKKALRKSLMPHSKN